MTNPEAGRRRRRRFGALLASVVLGVIPSTADAYTISNELSPGCHEAITSAALRTVRRDLATASPLEATRDERALIDDVQFTLDDDMRDLGGATLILAVRDNDLKGRSSDDLSQLAEVHGDPNAQEEHCLRGPNDKEPDGSKAAVDRCRAFIRARALTAIGGLDNGGMPDLSKRTTLSVYLSIRGQVHAPLPTYYVAAGQAIHAIEDSFTHTYRTADSKRITVVLNWIDQVNGTLVESRDGPGHATALDRCDDPDELRKARRLLAIEAATAFLRATLDPTKTKDEKMAAVDAVLDTYLSYSPGCTYDNDWCDAPENQYRNAAGCGCRVATGRAGGRGGRGFMFGFGVLLVFAMARRARRRRLRRRMGRGVAALSVLGALCLGATVARAEPPQETTTTSSTPETTTTTTTTPSEEPGTAATTATVETTPTTTTTTLTTPTVDAGHAPPPPTVVPVEQPGPVDQSEIALGAYAGLSGSVEKPALAGTLGLRLRATRAWTFGLDGEWNPWIAYNGTTVRKGVVNIYGTVMLRFPLAYENFNVRLSVSAGVSYLLMDLYGAPSGSLGLYIATSPLSIEWKLSRIFYLIINPINIALPVPQLNGVPLLYPQYRTTIGLEIYTG